MSAQAQIAPSADRSARTTRVSSPRLRAATPPKSARLAKAGADPGARDGHGRTPLHVAAVCRRAQCDACARRGGRRPERARERSLRHRHHRRRGERSPDAQGGAGAGRKCANVTSRYDGTALIASAHLAHAEIVRELIRAGAPLDHVNNLGWTALIESIVLGDGGARHTATLEALVDARSQREPRRIAAALRRCSLRELAAIAK